MVKIDLHITSHLDLTPEIAALAEEIESTDEVGSTFDPVVHIDELIPSSDIEDNWKKMQGAKPVQAPKPTAPARPMVASWGSAPSPIVKPNTNAATPARKPVSPPNGNPTRAVTQQPFIPDTFTQVLQAHTKSGSYPDRRG